MSMTPEDAMLLETTYADFVHAGAASLTPAQKEELKAMNGRIAELETDFSQKLTDGTAAAAPDVRYGRQSSPGLSQAEIDAAAKLATEMGQPGKYALALINTTQQAQLTSLTNRASRKKLLEASINRSSSGDEFDTTALIEETGPACARARPRCSASRTMPAYAMYDRMVKEPAEGDQVHGRTSSPRSPPPRCARRKMLEDMAASEGQNIKLEPWDWGYYAEKVRKARYDIDDATVRPYFEVWTARWKTACSIAANKFYGVTFKRRTDIPTYHPDMRVYTVYDKDGSELALFYFDPFARPNKQGGAWMGNFVEQSHLLGNKPVVFNSLNIAPPGRRRAGAGDLRRR